jgi:1-acyl-sn-glycerol-3-phosphate acyltransferase
MIDKIQTFVYWINIWTWVNLISRLVTKRDVKGIENVPLRGPVILAGNHLNVTDPPILTFVIPRRIVWMAKQELFDIPVAGALYRMFGCIPVRRAEADLRALRRSQQVLRRGHILGMFPEGTRSAGEGLQRAEPGTALLALRSGVPIVPVGIWGTENMKLPRDFLRRTHVNIVFGKPFMCPKPKRVTRKQIEETTDLMMSRIAELLPPKYRGVYREGAAGGDAATSERGG